MTTRYIETKDASINVMTVEGSDITIEATIYFGVNESLTEIQALHIGSLIIDILNTKDRTNHIEQLTLTSWKQ